MHQSHSVSLVVVSIHLWDWCAHISVSSYNFYIFLYRILVSLMLVNCFTSNYIDILTGNMSIPVYCALLAAEVISPVWSQRQKWLIPVGPVSWMSCNNYYAQSLMCQQQADLYLINLNQHGNSQNTRHEIQSSCPKGCHSTIILSCFCWFCNLTWGEICGTSASSSIHRKDDVIGPNYCILLMWWISWLLRENSFQLHTLPS